MKDWRSWADERAAKVGGRRSDGGGGQEIQSTLDYLCDDGDSAYIERHAFCSGLSVFLEEFLKQNQKSSGGIECRFFGCLPQRKRSGILS
jgi:hypothetical protein